MKSVTALVTLGLLLGASSPALSAATPEGAQKLTTDAKGEVTLNVKDAGMYYLETSKSVDGKDGQPGRRASYTGVLEFLPS